MKRISDVPSFNLLSNATIVAILALGALVTAAQAQQKKPQAPASPPLGLHPGSGSHASTTDGILNPGYAQGWNYVHATNCEIYDYNGYTYVVLYPTEGGDFWTTALPYQTLMLTACQSGNYIGVYVYDDNGDWNQLYTYDYY
jgi:hypothetical protein